MEPRKVLITGAAGHLGGYLARQWAGRYDLRLTDVRPPDGVLAAPHEFLELDIRKLEQMQSACGGIDTVVHLAADRSVSAPFYDSLLERNVIGVYNVFQAAADQKCRRLVFASSVNAMRGWPKEVCVTPEMPPNPLNLYGACKAFGEILGRTFRHLHGLSCLCIRFGSITAHSPMQNPDQPAEWITLRDAAQLTERCVEVEGIDYAVLHGFSRHRVCPFELEQTRKRVGYQPQDGTATPGYGVSGEKSSTGFPR
ncbi:MAG: NAD(P)-dependent oxidoreductase [Planctomycetes bacterium]|nr:NAD(P)-dependent oxidoreductase [Planctomycetota bacterium]